MLWTFGDFLFESGVEKICSKQAIPVKKNGQESSYVVCFIVSGNRVEVGIGTSTNKYTVYGLSKRIFGGKWERFVRLLEDLRSVKGYPTCMRCETDKEDAFITSLEVTFAVPSNVSDEKEGGIQKDAKECSTDKGRIKIEFVEAPAEKEEVKEKRGKEELAKWDIKDVKIGLQIQNLRWEGRTLKGKVWVVVRDKEGKERGGIWDVSFAYDKARKEYVAELTRRVGEMIEDVKDATLVLKEGVATLTVNAGGIEKTATVECKVPRKSYAPTWRPFKEQLRGLLSSSTTDLIEQLVNTLAEQGLNVRVSNISIGSRYEDKEDDAHVYLDAEGFGTINVSLHSLSSQIIDKITEFVTALKGLGVSDVHLETDRKGKFTIGFTMPLGIASSVKEFMTSKGLKVAEFFWSPRLGDSACVGFSETKFSPMAEEVFDSITVAQPETNRLLLIHVIE